MGVSVDNLTISYHNWLWDWPRLKYLKYTHFIPKKDKNVPPFEEAECCYINMIQNCGQRNVLGITRNQRIQRINLRSSHVTYWPPPINHTEWECGESFPSLSPPTPHPWPLNTLIPPRVTNGELWRNDLSQPSQPVKQLLKS